MKLFPNPLVKRKISVFALSFIFLFPILMPFIGYAQPKQEFRAVWVATVDNIDWPEKGTIDPEKQKEQFIKLIEMHHRNGMNAVIVQIRPAADAFYPSPYEPWSEWLTGKQGVPPRPYYDPLEFMITETHKRGMEFHAWLNPYRALFSLKKSIPSPTHATRVHPDWFLDYGDKRYFDPGNREVQDFVVNVVKDVVSRYPVDAIHFDDYFYPYTLPGKVFPDQVSYVKYGSGMELGDWRRSNVDSIIVKLSRAIRSVSPTCRFGISPFGVWRNRDRDSLGSNTQAGQTNYDDLYADILLWLRNGWIDYVAPQLYWEFGHPRAAYETLVDWWSKNTYGKHCYIGLGIYRAGSNTAWRDPSLLPRQIRMLRERPEVQGMIFFSSKSFEKNPNGWNDSLRHQLFEDPAIVPPMAWIDDERPEKPLVKQLTSSSSIGQRSLQLVAQGNVSGVKQFVVYEWESEDAFRLRPERSRIRILPAGDGVASITIDDPANSRKLYAFSAVDRENNESEKVYLNGVQ
jgi:uncharacterized lipoprotein YddW (UPF0748 family)